VNGSALTWVSGTFAEAGRLVAPTSKTASAAAKGSRRITSTVPGAADGKPSAAREEPVRGAPRVRRVRQRGMAGQKRLVVLSLPGQEYRLRAAQARAAREVVRLAISI